MELLAREVRDAAATTAAQEADLTDRSGRAYPGLARIIPRLDILPDPQREVWKRLALLPVDAVLYGGTALALRLGHRASLDFDLFLPRSFQPGDMAREIAAVEPTETAMSADNTLVVRVGDVLVSLFGVKLRAVGAPEVAADIGLPIASLLDLGATKMAAVVDRAEARDYLDVAALLDAGMDIADMLGAAQAVFGPRFSPLLALKALTSFADGDLPSLDGRIQRRLTTAATNVARIPVVGARTDTVSPFDIPGG
jgi:hypothetical protein